MISISANAAAPKINDLKRLFLQGKKASNGNTPARINKIE